MWFWSTESKASVSLEDRIFQSPRLLMSPNTNGYKLIDSIVVPIIRVRNMSLQEDKSIYLAQGNKLFVIWRDVVRERYAKMFQQAIYDKTRIGPDVTKMIGEYCLFKKGAVQKPEVETEKVVRRNVFATLSGV